VYFLTEVSENDLLNFTLSDTVTLPEEDSITAEVEGRVDASYDTDSTESDAMEDDEVQMPEDKSGIGSKIFVIIILALVFAGAYYVKVYKPKHEDDDEEYEEEDEAEEESEYEEESESEADDGNKNDNEK
jgi:flagellar biosynthesis/type III secretory pathway M-ring protein FliF/YscJ